MRSKLPVATLLILFFLACKPKVAEADLQKLNGYWEIEKVVFPDGSSKTYRVNKTVDFIKLDEMKGFRKKVYPKLSGGFEVNSDAEDFQITSDESHYYFNYVNDLSQWRERLERISEDRFSVVNEENIEYYYKRHEPISLK